ncbi:MAG: ATP-binding cassette domain-containing protein, partial [Pirellulales bacterium]|nr:ATP-binding cassette domain-containing protein [Pirellulales bacterium]
GTVVRCDGLAIGYPDHRVADDISLEIEHGQRAAIVGDNGQGKTTLLRTLVHSLDPLGGTLKWGYGVEIGTYAQHVYTSLDERLTVIEHLEYTSDSETTRQDLLAMAGALLFRDDHIHKKIKVLSGGERARLCMAGLLLGTANVLVLDEPGNHLDVETVEALAEALEQYRGTVIFTSHDRHFMHRVATSVIEVRDGRVKNYFGNYDSYLTSVEKEVDQGQRELAGNQAKAAATGGGPPKSKSTDYRQNQRDQRRVEKEIKNLEKKIGRLDDEKRELQARLMNETNPDEAVRLHEEITRVGEELSQAEERWMELSADD